MLSLLQLIVKFVCCIYSSIDIDECTTGVHGCLQTQQCINRPGNYVCECVTGYELLNGTCEGNALSS